MNPRGLIFDGALIPGVMSGAVTVTSRVMNPQPPEGADTWLCGAADQQSLADWRQVGPRDPITCPFRVGQRRYVKERWRPWGWREDGPIIIEFGDGARRAETGGDEDAPGYEEWYEGIATTAIDHLDAPLAPECARKSVPQDSEGCYHWFVQGENPLAWRSPLFLPRYCARTWIEITAVRPARCQEITEEEILASGIRYHDGLGVGLYGWRYSADSPVYVTPRIAYSALWDRLNKARGYPWSMNHWVWRVTFRTVKP